MSYPSSIEQYCPSSEFDDFLRWLATYPSFRELEPSTQEVIKIAQFGSFEDMFFQILLYRIWDSPEAWKVIGQATNYNIFAFDFAATVAALDDSPIKQPQSLPKRRVLPAAWNRAGWSPETKHPTAEFHFRSLVKMIGDGIPQYFQDEAKSLQDVEKTLVKYPGITAAIAPGLVQDLGYTPYLKVWHSNYLRLSSKATEALEKCFLWKEKGWKDIIQTLWAWLDEYMMEVTGTPAPTLAGRKPSLQGLQDALAAWKQRTSFKTVDNPVLPIWWSEEEPSSAKVEVEVIPDQPAPPTKIITRLEDFAEMFSDLEQEGAIAFESKLTTLLPRSIRTAPAERPRLKWSPTGSRAKSDCCSSSARV